MTSKTTKPNTKSKKKNEKTTIQPTSPNTKKKNIKNKNNNQIKYNYQSFSTQQTMQSTSLTGGYSRLVGGFGGYHGSKHSETFSFDRSNKNMDPQIEYCLKRVLKRDSITKLKGLQDLQQLFSTATIAQLEAASPAWAHVFTQLSLVNDRRIRQHLHLCFLPFCKKIAQHKSGFFTPHLKRIFIYWWMHVHDPCSEVSIAALQSFEASFGTNETHHWKVISFVKPMLISQMIYYTDIKTNADTLSKIVGSFVPKSKKKKGKKKSNANQDNIERYERIITSVLNSLATLITKENEIQQKRAKKQKKAHKKKTNINSNININDWFTDYTDILLNNSIWRFINHRSTPMIRNAAYLLCIGCMSNPSLATKIIPLMSNTLFKCMSNESCISNLDNLWIALLCVVQYQQCWRYSKKKSFLSKFSQLIKIDIFVACKYLRSFLLFIPFDYLFNNQSSANDNSNHGKKKLNDKKCASYEICKLLKNIWLSTLQISHLQKKYESIINVYFKILLQLLLFDNKCKSDGNHIYIYNDNEEKSNSIDNQCLSDDCKNAIIEYNIISLMRISLKELDCPLLFFTLMSQTFLPQIIEYKEEYLMDEMIEKLSDIKIHVYYNTVVVACLHCVYQSIKHDFIQPIIDLMQLRIKEDDDDDDDELVIQSKTENFVQDCKLGFAKVNAFVEHLKPFVVIENIIFNEEEEKEIELESNVHPFWNEKQSVKYVMNQLMHEIWKFQYNIALIPHMNISIDTEEEDESNANDEICIDFYQLFIDNPMNIAYEICHQSLTLCKTIILSLCLDFKLNSSTFFNFEHFIQNEILIHIQFISSKLQTILPLEYSASIIELLFNISNIILNSSFKDWQLFLQTLLNFELLNMKNFSIFIDCILIENRSKHTIIQLCEPLVIQWLSTFLNVSMVDNAILLLSATSVTIPAESYTSLILSLQKLMSDVILSPKCLILVIKQFVDYIDCAIDHERDPKTKKYPGITKNKTHTVIRSLTTFLEHDWIESESQMSIDDKKELNFFQLLIVSKLFTLCFARKDSKDTQNISSVCEYIFKTVIRYRPKIYSSLLETMANSLRIPFFFTTKNIDFTNNNSSFVINEEYKIPIIVNGEHTRWRWCIQVLLLIQNTNFEHALTLIDILLNKNEISRMFSLALLSDDGWLDESLVELSSMGVSLFTLQKCRDVVCDLCDVIGMDLVLYEPYSNANYSSLSDDDVSKCCRVWLVCWLLSFEEKLSWLPLSTLPDPSIIEHTCDWRKAQKSKRYDDCGMTAIFGKPRHFSSVLQMQMILKTEEVFQIPQSFVDNCAHFCSANDNVYGTECPVEIRSRVFGYFVNLVNIRMNHSSKHLDRELKNIVSNTLKKSKSNENENKNENENDLFVNKIKIMESIFVMFPDLVPISFIRHIVKLANISVKKLSTNEESINIVKCNEIILELRLLFDLLRPLHGIALNITNGYQTPSTDDITHEHTIEYRTSVFWGKYREWLVGVLFELFSYINHSFEWYFNQLHQNMNIDEENGDENDEEDNILSVMQSTEFKKDLCFWYSSVLTLISHSLIVMNSEGDKDVFFDLDWSSLIFVANFVMDHILHERSEFLLCLHSYLSEFYQFLIQHSSSSSLIPSKVNNIQILHTINTEYRYVMHTLWNGMGVLRQIAARSRDLSSRKNLKKKYHKNNQFGTKTSFIFESLELLTEILSQEIWRNLLSSEALSSPFHKLGIPELEVEELIYMSCVNTTNNAFLMHSGLMSRSLSNVSSIKQRSTSQTSDMNYVNITPCYTIHAILDELFHSINDLLSHPLVMTPSTQRMSTSPSHSPSNIFGKYHLNQHLCKILMRWHYQLFDALNSTHHQIVAAALRILSISIRWHVLQNMHLFVSLNKKKKKKNIIEENEQNKNEQKSENPESKQIEILQLNEELIKEHNIDDELIEDDNISNLSINTSVSFSLSTTTNNNNHISKKQKKKFNKIHTILNNILPIMYLLPCKSKEFVPSHEIRTWFLCWWLFMHVVEEIPLEFKLDIVHAMKHDSTSPLGSFTSVIREIVEHIYITDSLESNIQSYINKLNSGPNNNTFFSRIFKKIYILPDFYSNYPCNDPSIISNLLARCRWIHQQTGNVFNKRIFFSTIAITVYSKLLSNFPSLCRYWLLNNIKDRITRDTVSKITSQYFSSLILDNIFNNKMLNKNFNDLKLKNEFDNIVFDEEIKIYLKIRSVNDREIEGHFISGMESEIHIVIVCKYPLDYPLKGVMFEWVDTCGLPTNKCKNWKMLMTGMMNNQNASICEVFMLWCINIHKHYEGIDECPICYSIVHPIKKTLPSVKCQQCKGKFHRYCIYRWTKTSQKNSCPLCRSFI